MTQSKAKRRLEGDVQCWVLFCMEMGVAGLEKR